MYRELLLDAKQFGSAHQIVALPTHFFDDAAAELKTVYGQWGKCFQLPRL